MSFSILTKEKIRGLFESINLLSKRLENYLKRSRVINYQSSSEEIPERKSWVGTVVSDTHTSEIGNPEQKIAVCDGYATMAEYTFQATELNPVFLSVKGEEFSSEQRQEEGNNQSFAFQHSCVFTKGGQPLPDGRYNAIIPEKAIYKDPLSPHENEIYLIEPVVPGSQIYHTGKDKESQLRLYDGYPLPYYTLLYLIQYGEDERFVKIREYWEEVLNEASDLNPGANTNAESYKNIPQDDEKGKGEEREKRDSGFMIGILPIVVNLKDVDNNKLKELGESKEKDSEAIKKKLQAISLLSKLLSIKYGVRCSLLQSTALTFSSNPDTKEIKEELVEKLPSRFFQEYDLLLCYPIYHQSTAYHFPLELVKSIELLKRSFFEFYNKFSNLILPFTDNFVLQITDTIDNEDGGKDKEDNEDMKSTGTNKKRMIPPFLTFLPEEPVYLYLYLFYVLFPSISLALDNTTLSTNKALRSKKGRIMRDLGKGLGKEELIFVKCVNKQADSREYMPLGSGSGYSLDILLSTDGFILIPQNIEGIYKGSEITVYELI